MFATVFASSGLRICSAVVHSAGVHSTVMHGFVMHGFVIHSAVIHSAVMHLAISHGSVIHATVIRLRSHVRRRDVVAHRSARQIHSRKRLAAKCQQRQHSDDHFGPGNTHAQMIQSITSP